jgi:hypothetical protein
MRKAWMALALGLILGLAPLASRPALALSCVHPRDQLPRLPLIVQAKVEKVEPRFKLPGRGQPADDITLTVSRYFKGEGPAKLEAVFDGLGWETMSPVGSEVIMGFMVDENGSYQSGACSLRISAKPTNGFEAEMLALIQKEYGEGRAPLPGPETAPTESGPLAQWALWGSLGALAALIVALRLRQSAKAKR